MQLNSEGLNLIKSFEGCRLSAYQDQRGIWSIGYGHTEYVQPGETITQEQADSYLKYDLDRFCRTVKQYVHVDLNDNQFSALVSLVYNIGGAAFLNSTLLRVLNQGDYASAAEEFLVWENTHHQTNYGLVRRRNAERTLFLA